MFSGRCFPPHLGANTSRRVAATPPRLAANTMDPQACYELLKERAKVSNTITPPVPPPAAGPLEGMSLAVLGQRLLHWQSERVGAYQRFEEGFVRFLQVAEAQGYEALVASTTAAFASISDEINAICAEMVIPSMVEPGTVMRLKSRSMLYRSFRYR